jgi:alkaline phosphatase D
MPEETAMPATATIAPSLRTSARKCLRRGAPIALALAAGLAQAGVAQGPMVQAVTSRQAGVWVRTTTDQAVRVHYAAPDGSGGTTAPITTSLVGSDDTAAFVLTGLQPGTRYTYQVGTTDPDSGVETWTGDYAFDTVQGVVDALKIAVLSDFALHLKASPALQTAIDARPDLLAVIGDLDHRDPAKDDRNKFYPPEDWQIVLDHLRNMHRDTRDPATPLGRNFWSGLVGDAGSGRPQLPWVYAWDDHDYCANNTDRSCPFKPESVRAFDEYYIAAPDNAFAAGCPGDFESLTYGKLAHVFFLDARSQSNLALPDGKTAMLGACQHRWLVDGLHKSKALWKIVMSPTPLNATVKPWDAWSHFPGERAKFLADVADVHNLVLVSGDIHTGGAVDEGEHSGLPEVSTPNANMPPTWVNTFCKDQDGMLISRPGSWTIGSNLDPDVDVKPMNCLAKTFPDDYPVDRLVAPVYPLDGHENPGYTWIEATRTALTITVRDTAGNVKQGVRADLSPAALMLSRVPD